MTRVIWGEVGKRSFESGIDRCVLYVENGFGVPWNGLTSVSESPTGGEPRPYYIDGVKYLNLAAKEEFEATINALGAPPEFAACDGTKSLGRGLFATQQKRKQFDFTYRTLVGNDIQGTDHGYKIHLVYNALAKPTSRNQQTLTKSTSPMVLSWAVSTIPEVHEGMIPTSHFIIDSRDTHPFILTYLEAVLYGMKGTDAKMPTIDELIAIFNFPTDKLDGVTLNLLGVGSTSKGRVTNLFTNPSFEADSWTLSDAYTSLSTNPWHRDDGVNPLTSNNSTLYLLERDTTFASEGVPSTPDGITSGVKCSPKAANVGSTLLSAYNADNLSNTNPARAAGTWVWVSRAGYRAIMSNGELTTLPSRKWTWVKSGAQAANTHMTLVISHTDNVEPGDFAFVTGATALSGTTPPEFAMWGSMTSPDPDFTVYYTGDNPLLSQTWIRGWRPAGVSAVSSAWASVFKSKKHAIGGSQSARVGPYGDSAVTANSSIAAYANAVPITEVGVEYTFVCNVTKEAPTSSLPRLYGAIGIHDGTAVTFSEESDNVAGVSQPRVKVQRIADTFTLRFIQGQPKDAASDVYFDTATLVEGDYSGPPFSPYRDVVFRKQKIRPRWSGVTDESASYFEYYRQLTEAADLGDAYIIENQLFVFIDDMWTLIGVLP